MKTFASISDDDFNELFTPLKERGGVILFDTGKEDLDDDAKKLLEDRWSDRKGARYFFVVARASKTGSPDKNRALSHRRANSVMYYLKELSKDPEIDSKVGLLWLGNEFAQLSEGVLPVAELTRGQEVRRRIHQPQRLRVMGGLPALRPSCVFPAAAQRVLSGCNEVQEAARRDGASAAKPSPP